MLTVKHLKVTLDTPAGPVQAVRDVTFHLNKGETLAIVGESGCGKSITALSLMGLLPHYASVTGQYKFAGQVFSHLSEKAWRGLRGNRIAMIFQNPMTALNPTMRVGDQIAEVLQRHKKLTKRQALVKAEQLLSRLHITQTAKRMRQYPFEFSGGMLQRVVIAISIACEPDILIADEPTTALDVTVQAEVLSLLKELQQERQMGLILITHDLAVVAQVADRIAVMYAGEIVEQGDTIDLFKGAKHPYTRGLQHALPDFQVDRSQPLQAIPGSPPDLIAPPEGCGFCLRCSKARVVCEHNPPPIFQHDDSHTVRCWLLDRRA